MRILKEIELKCQKVGCTRFDQNSKDLKRRKTDETELKQGRAVYGFENSPLPRRKRN
jgi:hypothetical protein